MMFFSCLVILDGEVFQVVESWNEAEFFLRKRGVIEFSA